MTTTTTTVTATDSPEVKQWTAIYRQRPGGRPAGYWLRCPIIHAWKDDELTQSNRV